MNINCTSFVRVEDGYLTSCNEAIFQLDGEQTMPKDGLAKIANFAKFCEKQRNTYDFALGNIANIDETLVWVDIPSETAVDQRGLKTVSI